MSIPLPPESALDKFLKKTKSQRLHSVFLEDLTREQLEDYYERYVHKDLSSNIEGHRVKLPRECNILTAFNQVQKKIKECCETLNFSPDDLSCLQTVDSFSTTDSEVTSDRNTETNLNVASQSEPPSRNEKSVIPKRKSKKMKFFREISHMEIDRLIKIKGTQLSQAIDRENQHNPVFFLQSVPGNSNPCPPIDPGQDYAICIKCGCDVTTNLADRLKQITKDMALLSVINIPCNWFFLISNGSLEDFKRMITRIHAVYTDNKSKDEIKNLVQITKSLAAKTQTNLCLLWQPSLEYLTKDDLETLNGRADIHNGQKMRIDLLELKIKEEDIRATEMRQAMDKDPVFEIL